MKIINKLVILGITFVTVGSAISPIENVFADDQSTTIISQENTEFDKYYNDLSDSKKAEFKKFGRRCKPIKR